MSSNPLRAAHLSIDGYLHWLAPELWPGGDVCPALPVWPPDVFAISASLLERSGAYTKVVGEWPPEWEHWWDVFPGQVTEGSDGDVKTIEREAWYENGWKDWIEELGESWTLEWPEIPEAVHEILTSWWCLIHQHRQESVRKIGDIQELCQALLQLLAAADEACFELGPSLMEVSHDDALEGDETLQPSFIEEVGAQLSLASEEGGSLCRDIHPSKVRVLPKSRTPGVGLTLRSLSLNLALCSGCEVKIEWTPCTGFKHPVQNYVNLLLIPWPEVVKPIHFAPLKRSPDARPRTDGYEMFEFEPERELDPNGRRDAARAKAEKVLRLIESAKRSVEKVDGVIFPECALSREDFEEIQRVVAAANCFLIAGVRDRDPSTEFAINKVETRVPTGKQLVEIKQHKHHRWKLEHSQIRTYGLSARLHPEDDWWEGIELGSRELNFFSLFSKLTVCALICEDLARQEPMAEIIRSVGPNLVVCLLMDGPQLATRWPGRYATVLADDPGSSVLTFSSLGMVNFSRPSNVDIKASTPVVGLWKDPKHAGATPIEITTGHEAVVISLVGSKNREVAADGREADETDRAWILGGIHQIRDVAT